MKITSLLIPLIFVIMKIPLIKLKISIYFQNKNLPNPNSTVLSRLACYS